MALTVSSTLDKALKGAETAHDTAIAESINVVQNHNYSNEYRDKENRRIIAEAAEKVETLKAEGAAAIAEKVDALNAEEASRAETRAADTEYLQRLQTKLDMTAALIRKSVTADGVLEQKNTPNMPKETLKAIFAEFANDPLAIALLNERFPMLALEIAPQDDTGKARRHLTTQIQPVFVYLMDQIGKMPARGATMENDAPAYNFAKAEAAAFLLYLQKQDDNFTMSYEELLDTIAAEYPNLKTAAESVKWRFQLAEKASDYRQR